MNLAVFRATAIRVLHPRNWRPLAWVVLVILLAAALALVVVVVPPTDYAGSSEQGLFAWTLGIVLLRLTITAAGLSVAGAILRALSHNVPARKNLDFAGKLFAVAATSLVFTGALLTVPPEDLRSISEWFWRAWGLTVKVLGGVIVAELIVGILIIRSRPETESPPAIRVVR